MLYKDCYQLVF